MRYSTGFENLKALLLLHVAISVKGKFNGFYQANLAFSSSPERTLVFLKGFVNEHVSLHFVLPIERRLAQSALVWFLTWKTPPESLHTAGRNRRMQQQ